MSDEQYYVAYCCGLGVTKKSKISVIGKPESHGWSHYKCFICGQVFSVCDNAPVMESYLDKLLESYWDEEGKE